METRGRAMTRAAVRELPSGIRGHAKVRGHGLDTNGSAGICGKHRGDIVGMHEGTQDHSEFSQ